MMMQKENLVSCSAPFGSFPFPFRLFFFSSFMLCSVRRQQQIPLTLAFDSSMAMRVFEGVR